MSSLSLFFRSLDDAFCALIHGHTRRDWKRTRVARLRLPVQREISQMESEAASEGYFSLYATSCRLSAQSLTSHLERIIYSVDCEAYRILLDHLLIERSNLHARRVFQRQYLEALYNFNKARIQRPIMAVVDPTSKQYGKFLKGLGQSLAFDPLHDKRRFYIRYWHRLLAPLLQVSVRPFQSAKVISPP